MNAAWVAGSVRARALVRRRIGTQAARRLAGAGSLDDALRELAVTPYGREVRSGQSLTQAQHGVAAVALWHMRVLAGWLPRSGIPLMRALSAWFEMANTDALLRAMAGGGEAQFFQLGALATAWPRLRGAPSAAAVRAVMASSAWGDPGADSLAELRFGIRARWARRVADLGDPARTWACGAAALLVAGERFTTRRQLPPGAVPALCALIGDAAIGAPSLAQLAGSVTARARWALDGVQCPGDLWQAEAAWWARVRRDAAALLAARLIGSEPVLGAAALLADDAWRVRAALEIAARGGRPLEAYDAVA